MSNYYSGLGGIYGVPAYSQTSDPKVLQRYTDSASPTAKPKKDIDSFWDYGAPNIWRGFVQGVGNLPSVPVDLATLALQIPIELSIPTSAHIWSAFSGRNPQDIMQESRDALDGVVNHIDNFNENLRLGDLAVKNGYLGDPAVQKAYQYFNNGGDEFTLHKVLNPDELKEYYAYKAYSPFGEIIPNVVPVSAGSNLAKLALKPPKGVVSGVKTAIQSMPSKVGNAVKSAPVKAVQQVKQIPGQVVGAVKEHPYRTAMLGGIGAYGFGAPSILESLFKDRDQLQNNDILENRN